MAKNSLTNTISDAGNNVALTATKASLNAQKPTTFEGLVKEMAFSPQRLDAERAISYQQASSVVQNINYDYATDEEKKRYKSALQQMTIDTDYFQKRGYMSKQDARQTFDFINIAEQGVDSIQFKTYDDWGIRTGSKEYQNDIQKRIDEIYSNINSATDTTDMLNRGYQSSEELGSLIGKLRQSKYVEDKLVKAQQAAQQENAYAALTDKELEATIESLNKQKEEVENRIITSDNPDMAGADAEIKQGEIDRQQELNDLDDQIKQVEREQNLRARQQKREGYEAMRNNPDYKSVVYAAKNGLTDDHYTSEDLERIFKGNGATFSMNPKEDAFAYMLDGIVENRGFSDATRKFGVLYGTEEQQDMYLYLYETQGYKAAQDYLEIIAPEINKRVADMATSNGYDNSMSRAMTGFMLGMENWLDNVIQGFNNEPMPETVAEFETQNLAQMNTSRFQDIAFSSATSAGNMVFPMLLSVCAGGLVGGTSLGEFLVGAEKISRLTNAAGVGFGAMGQAKGQALREGYSADAAAQYGVINGMSEAALQYALGKAAGTLVGFGGTLTETATNKIKSAFANMFADDFARNVAFRLTDIAGDAGGEFVEEYLQEVFDPVYRNVALGEKNDFQFYTDEALTAGLSGALMGAVFGTVGFVRDYRYIKAGTKTINDATEQLATEVGKAMPEDTVVKKLADYYAEVAAKGSIPTLQAVVEYITSEEVDGEEVSKGYNDMINNVNQYLEGDNIDWEMFRANADNALLGEHSEAYRYGAQKAFMEQIEIMSAKHLSQLTPTLDNLSDPALRNYKNIKRVVNLSPAIFEMEDGNKVAYGDIVWEDENGNKVVEYSHLNADPDFVRGFLSLKSANLFLNIAKNNSNVDASTLNNLAWNVYSAGRLHVSKRANEYKTPASSLEFLYNHNNHSTNGKNIVKQLYDAGYNDATEYNKTARIAGETLINKIGGYAVTWFGGRHGLHTSYLLGQYGGVGRNGIEIQEVQESIRVKKGDDVKEFSIPSTIVHEATHGMKRNNPSAFNTLQTFLLDYMREEIPNEFEEFKRELVGMSRQYSRYADEEVVARTMESLVQTREFAEALRAYDPDLFASVGSELVSAIRLARSTNTMAAWLREDHELVDAIASIWIEGTLGKDISAQTTEKMKKATEELAKRKAPQPEDGNISESDASANNVETWEEAEALSDFDYENREIVNPNTENIELDFSAISEADEFFGEKSSEIYANIDNDTASRITDELITENGFESVDSSLKAGLESAIDSAISYLAVTPEPNYAVATTIIREAALNIANSMTDINGVPMYVGEDAKNIAHDVALQFFKKYAEASENISPETATRIINEVNRVLEEERERAKNNREEAIRKTKEMMRMRQERAKLRDRIRKQLKDIARLAIHPSKKNHIPRALVQYLYDIANALDPTSNRRNSKVNDQWRAIKDYYETLKNDPDYAGAIGAYNSIIAQYIQKISDITQTRKMVDLNNDELRMVRDILGNILHIFRTGEEFSAKNLPENVQKAVEDTITKIRDIQRNGNPLTNAYLAKTLNPERFFRRLTNYDESNPLMISVVNLINGELRSAEFSRGYAKLFDKMNENAQTTKEGKKIAREYARRYNNLDRNWIKVTLGGQEVEITESMAISLAMHARNNDNMRHITNGGVVIPNKELYSKDWLSSKYMKRAYAEKGETIILDGTVDADGNIKSSEIDEIVKTFDDFDNWMLETSIEYFEHYSADALNEVSMELDGFKVANVKNYFPIVVDPLLLNSVTYDLDTGRQTTVISSSMLYPRADNASSRILLNGITKDLNRSADFVARYYGLAAPVKDFNRIIRGSSFGEYQRYDVNPPRDSVRAAITAKWGIKADEYIHNMLDDLTGARSSYRDTFLDKMRSNAAQAVLTFNLSVSIKQAASFFSAISELGYIPVMKSLVKGGKGGLPISRADQTLIGEYTPILWQRTQNTSIQETAEMRMGNRGVVQRAFAKVPYLTEWINKVDAATVGRLWYAVENWVDKNRADLAKGSDEYYDAVAQKYNQVVIRTQPNYTVMTRPEILRSDNQLARALFMFKTQPLQNAGILVDSFSEFRARLDEYNSNPNDDSRALLRASGKRLVDSITSQMLQTLVFVGMTWFSNLALHNMKRYKDDETGEITLASTMWELMWQYFDSIAGDTIVIDWLEDIAAYATRKWVVGEDVTYYAPSVFGLEELTDLFSTTIEVGDDISEGNDVSKYKIKKIATSLASLAGLPVNNVINVFNAFIDHATDLANARTLGEALGLTSRPKTADQFVRKMLNGGDVDELMEGLKSLNTFDSESVSAFREAYMNGDDEDREKIKGWIKEYFGYGDADVKEVIKNWGGALKDEFKDADANGRQSIIEELKRSFGYSDEDVTKWLNSMPKSGKLEKEFAQRYRAGEDVDTELREVYRLDDDAIALLKIDWSEDNKMDREYQKETYKAEASARGKVEDFATDVDSLREDYKNWLTTGSGNQITSKKNVGKYFAKLWQTTPESEHEQIWQYAKAVYDYKDSNKKTTINGWANKDLTQYETIKLDWDEVGRTGMGNIDLYKSVILENDDTSISTIGGIIFEEDGRYIVIPTIVNKNGSPTRLSREEAIEQYHDTNDYLGKFYTKSEAQDYLAKVEEQQSKLYVSNKQ